MALELPIDIIPQFRVCWRRYIYIRQKWRSARVPWHKKKPPLHWAFRAYRSCRHIRTYTETRQCKSFLFGLNNNNLCSDFFFMTYNEKYENNHKKNITILIWSIDQLYNNNNTVIIYYYYIMPTAKMAARLSDFFDFEISTGTVLIFPQKSCSYYNTYLSISQSCCKSERLYLLLRSS